MSAVDVKTVGLSDGLSVCVFLCVRVFPGSDETLSLTRCCSVKVKPYRMSGMMTRTERFHLIPPFPFFPSVPPICLPRLRLRPPHSQDKTDIYRPSPTVCIKTHPGCVGLYEYLCVYACVCKQCQVIAIPLVRPIHKCLRPLCLCLCGWPGLYNPLSNIFASVYNGCTFTDTWFL